MAFVRIIFLCLLNSVHYFMDSSAVQLVYELINAIVRRPTHKYSLINVYTDVCVIETSINRLHAEMYFSSTLISVLKLIQINHINRNRPSDMTIDVTSNLFKLLQWKCGKWKAWMGDTQSRRVCAVPSEFVVASPVWLLARSAHVFFFLNNFLANVEMCRPIVFDRGDTTTTSFPQQFPIALDLILKYFMADRIALRKLIFKWFRIEILQNWSQIEWFKLLKRNILLRGPQLMLFDYNQNCTKFNVLTLHCAAMQPIYYGFMIAWLSIVRYDEY